MRRYRASFPDRSAKANLKNRLNHLSARRETDRALNAAARKLFVEFKTGQPCEDCKQEFPFYVMEYHHVRGKKFMAVGRMIGKYAWERILAEIEKCVLLCANCHRIRTHGKKENMGRRVGRPPIYKMPGEADDS